MNRICWWLVDRLSRILESDERDAVLGDFAESGVTGARALCDLLGFVVRRQAAWWKDWRPWLALLGLVAPLGMLLSLVSRWWAEGGAIYSCIYFDNWTWGYLESPGARRDLVDTLVRFLTDYSALIGWSWTIGFVLGSLSRGTIWVNGVLFYLVLFGGTLGSTTSASNPLNDGIFSLAFYSVVFPLVLRTVLVVLPSLWGMHKGFRLATLPLLQTIFWAVAIVIMTVLASRGLQASVICSQWQIEGLPTLTLASLRCGRQLGDNCPLWLLPLAVMWPVGYMAATASWQRWRGKSVSA